MFARITTARDRLKAYIATAQWQSVFAARG
jgi:hypothetical protein